MISFRQKVIEKDLLSEIPKYLKNKKIPYTMIKKREANKVSQINSKAMVIRSYKSDSSGKYRIEIQDKALYRYTQKLVEEIFGMKITDIDQKNRVITAETSSEGLMMDFIELLGLKYNLSIVE